MKTRKIIPLDEVLEKVGLQKTITKIPNIKRKKSKKGAKNYHKMDYPEQIEHLRNWDLKKARKPKHCKGEIIAYYNDTGKPIYQK